MPNVGFPIDNPLLKSRANHIIVDNRLTLWLQ